MLQLAVIETKKNCDFLEHRKYPPHRVFEDKLNLRAITVKVVPKVTKLAFELCHELFMTVWLVTISARSYFLGEKNHYYILQANALTQTRTETEHTDLETSKAHVQNDCFEAINKNCLLI